MKSRTIAITRPMGKGEETAEFVRSLGWTPFIFHTVKLKPLDHLKIRGQIDSALSQGAVDWIVFMSGTGARLFLDNLRPQNRDAIVSQETRFLAVGPKTRAYLLHSGIEKVESSDRYSSAGVDEWLSRLNPKPGRIILIRSSAADSRLADSLEAQGVDVTTINVYESGIPRDTQSVFEFLEGLRMVRFAAVLFTSAVSVSNLYQIAEAKLAKDDVTGLLKKVVVGAIGPVTAEPLRSRGIETIVPDEYLLERAIAKLISKSVRVPA